MAVKRKPVILFISVDEMGAAMHKFKNHREHVEAEFVKHGYTVIPGKFAELRMKAVHTSIKGVDVPGVMVVGVIGASLFKL